MPHSDDPTALVEGHRVTLTIRHRGQLYLRTRNIHSDRDVKVTLELTRVNSSDRRWTVRHADHPTWQDRYVNGIAVAEFGGYAPGTGSALIQDAIKRYVTYLEGADHA
jgi:hypothetical protein